MLKYFYAQNVFLLKYKLAKNREFNRKIQSFISLKLYCFNIIELLIVVMSKSSGDNLLAARSLSASRAFTFSNSTGTNFDESTNCNGNIHTKRSLPSVSN